MNVRIPEGWQFKQLKPEKLGCYLLTTPSTRPPVLMATVDFRRRVFRGGLTVTGRAAVEITAFYTGRGWRQRLVDDAMAWLEINVAQRAKFTLRAPQADNAAPRRRALKAPADRRRARPRRR